MNKNPLFIIFQIQYTTKVKNCNKQLHKSRLIKKKTELKIFIKFLIMPFV